MTQTLEKKKYSIKTDFSLLSILLIPIGVALNVVGDQLVAALSLPLYLDSFGAVLAGYLARPVGWHADRCADQCPYRHHS